MIEAIRIHPFDLFHVINTKQSPFDVISDKDTGTTIVDGQSYIQDNTAEITTDGGKQMLGAMGYATPSGGFMPMETILSAEKKAARALHNAVCDPAKQIHMTIHHGDKTIVLSDSRKGRFLGWLIRRFIS